MAETKIGSKQVILLEKVPSLLGKGTTGLRAKTNPFPGAFGFTMETYWHHLLNAEDRPIKYNQGLQLPLAKLYGSGDVCLARYIGASELLGEEVVCKFTYHRAGEIQVADGADVSALLAAINAGLEENKAGVTLGKNVKDILAAP